MAVARVVREVWVSPRPWRRRRMLDGTDCCAEREGVRERVRWEGKSEGVDWRVGGMMASLLG